MRGIMKSRWFAACLSLLLVSTVPAVASAGSKRIMSINAAKVIAERALVESVYGLKIRTTESVQNLIASSFQGTSETKTEAQIKGITFDEVTYDEKKDVAKVTASVSLPSITNINGEAIDLKGKVFRRVAFATSTPKVAGPLKALRAAEIDAYKQLAKQIVGFTLESRTKVENYMLKSDVIKTKVMATLFLAEVSEYGWHKNGDAYVKMSLSLKDFADIIGEGVVGGGSAIVVEGNGAQVDDFAGKKKKKK